MPTVLSIYFTTVDTKTSVYYINKYSKCEEIFLERDMKKCSGKDTVVHQVRHSIHTGTGFKQTTVKIQLEQKT